MEEIEKKRVISDAPTAFNKTAIKEWFIQNGAKGIIKASSLANILGVSRRTIANAQRSGKLKNIGKCVFDLNDVVEWSLANPRMLGQDVDYWQVTEELVRHVKNTLNSKHQTFIRVWNNDVDDLTSEVCCAIAKKRKINGVDETYVINSTIISLWRKAKVRNLDKNISLESLKRGK